MRLSFLLLCGLAPLPALGWEHTVEYRFAGSEIASILVTEGMDEDPAVLHVGLSDLNGSSQRIEVESDFGLGDCPMLLQAAQGNPGVTLVLTANLNAQTMNGVTLVQCSER